MKTKKLLSLILLGMLCSIGNAWGTDVVRTLTATNSDGGMKVGDTYIKAVTIGDSNASWSSNKFKMGSSKSSSFDVEIKDAYSSSYTIKSITFSYDGSGRPSSFSGNGIAVTSNTSWSAGESTPTKVTFEISSSSSEVKIQQMVITLTPSAGGGGSGTKFTVTYNANGGTCGTTSATQASEGASLSLPTPTWTGYTFNGWYNAGTKIGDAGGSYTPTANITLYAKWTDNTEGKLFSYIDGNYGDKFQAFDGSGWVSADATDKSKTFTDGTTGAQFVITNGAWDKKSNSISALAKYKAGSGSSSSSMKVVVPSGYKATVKIWYNSYGTSKSLKIDGANQTAPTTILADGNTNAQVDANLVAIEVKGKSGDVVLTSNSTSNNIYIARVAVELTHVTGTISASGWNTFSNSYNLDLSTITNGTAYVASAAADGNVTLTSTDAKVAAGTGLMIKGTPDAAFTISTTSDDATFSGANLLVGLPNGGTVVKNDNNYVFGWSDPADPGFYLVNDAQPVLGAGKAYLHTAVALAPGLRIVEGENNATDTQCVENSSVVVKFIENGQLLIKRDGIVYDAMGHVIR